LPSTRDIRRRIRSVKGTQKITKAMKMVAAAKLRRAQDRITAARPYADTLARVLASVAARTEHAHPMLGTRPVGRVWLVVVTSDKGLCGAFNTNLLREAERTLAERGWEDVEVVAVGRKAADFFARRRWRVAHAERELMSRVTPEGARALADMLATAFTSAQVDEIWMLYNRFVSLIRHQPVLERLLPVEPPEVTPEERPIDYIYEPDPETLLEELLPRYVHTEVARALYDSAAAEQAARMTAMDAATKNADEMIAHLTLLYNRTRQAAITKEILEIVAGAEALAE